MMFLMFFFDVVFDVIFYVILIAFLTSFYMLFLTWFLKASFSIGQRYLVNYVKKYCAKFQNDWSSRFWVMMYTDFKNNKFQKNALKFCSINSQIVKMYGNPAWSNGRSNTHNFVNFTSINMKCWHNILKILYNHL